MPIIVKNEAVGVPINPENPRLKYGMSMVLQQQRADQESRLRAQDAQYDMARMGAMQQNQAMREPSLGEESMMVDQEIRSGMYEPDVVKSLREDERAARMIMRDRNLDATQRARALENIRSRMRMVRSTGKIQPMAQFQPGGQSQPMALQNKPPMTEAEYFSDPKNYKEAYMEAQSRLEAASPNTPLTPANIHAQMHNDYLEKERFLRGLQPQPQGQAPQGQQPAMGGQPQASYSGGNVSAGFGVPPVLAQSGLQQSGLAAYKSRISNDPKGVAGQLESFPPKFKLNDGTVVGSVFRNGQWVPETQSLFGGEASGQAMGSQVGGSAYQPTGNYTSPEVFGVANVLANPAQPPQPQGQPAVQQPNSQPYTAVSGGSVVDTAYDLVNADRSPATNFYNPENPEYARMRSADQSIVNSQRGTLGKPGGRYGLGMVDYGINPATGNRVTASIRPGSTMPEYDEPVGVPGTAMGGQKGTVTWQGRKGKKSETVSPGEQWSNANPYPESMPSVSSAPQSQAQEILPPETMDIPRDGIVSPMDPKQSGRPRYLEQKPPATQGEMSGWRESIRNFVTGREPGWGEPLPQEKNKKASTSKPTSTRNATRQNPWAEVGGPSASATDEVSRARNDLEAINSSQSTASGGNMGAIRKFAESQPAAIRDAIKEFYNPNTSRERAKAIAKMLLEKNIDLGVMEKTGDVPAISNSGPVSNSTMPSADQAVPAGNEASSGRKKPAYVSLAPEKPVESTYQSVEIKERTPQASLFLEKMKKFADSKGTAVSKAVMGVYDPKTPEATKVELIRGLAKMGVNLPDIEKRLKAEVLSQMTPEKTPKYPLKPRGFPTKESSPRIFES